MPSPRRDPRPLVALLGVPNAGKSTLFNRLLGQRRALVADEPGTTRDRISAPWKAEGKPAVLCDTGGFVGPGARGLQEEIERQTFTALSEASVVVMVIDGRAGVTAGDRDLAARLRPVADRVVLAWNKSDDPRRAEQAPEGFELGLGEPIPVSAEHGLGIADLIDAVASHLPPGVDPAPASGEEVRVAIVGRPNVGKSSLLNRLCGAERVTVAADPGTTRDAVDTEVIRRGRRYRFVDTAGIRRPSRAAGRVESLGVLMAKRAISRADVALILFDASEGLVSQDLTVAGLVEESGRAGVLVANKWDLVQDKEERIERLKREAAARLRFSRYAPFVTISALDGRRTDGLYALIDRVHEAGEITIPTPRLNRFLSRFRMDGSGATGPKLRYLTQVGTRPPTFLAFRSTPQALHFSEVRRLENRLREEFGIGPTPIRIRFRTEARKVGKAGRKRSGKSRT